MVDSPTLGLTEATASRRVSVSDLPAMGLAETAGLVAGVSAADSPTVSLVEAASINEITGAETKAGTDTLSVGLAETASVFVVAARGRLSCEYDDGVGRPYGGRLRFGLADCGDRGCGRAPGAVVGHGFADSGLTEGAVKAILGALGVPVPGPTCV